MHYHGLANGAWAHWADWGDCSLSCGGGRRTRSRSCNNPLPDPGGSLCPTSDFFWLSITSDGTLKQTDTQTCNLDDCPTTTSTTTPFPKGRMNNLTFYDF